MCNRFVLDAYPNTVVKITFYCTLRSYKRHNIIFILYWYC
jgi:hypothetical protein